MSEMSLGRKLKKMIQGGNGAGKPDELQKERIRKLTPVAKKIIELIAEAELPIGDVQSLSNELYSEVSKKILEVMLESNVKYVDRDFLFQLVLQPFDGVRELVGTSLRSSFDEIIDRALHKEFRELTMKDMDVLLKG